jgi:hypothetical protein
MTHSKEQSLQWEFNECLRREEVLWRQKSRVTWLPTLDFSMSSPQSEEEEIRFAS